MSKVLITGAGGYIGSIATYLFLQKEHEVVALDNFSTGYRQPLDLLQRKFGESKLKFYNSDLTQDFTHVLNKEKDISAVLHYAASCSVDESMKDPGKYFKNNVLGTLNLLEFMLKSQVKNIIFSSTCAVYGEAEYVPVDEKHPTNPSNSYGESKLMTEKMIKWFGKLKGIHYCILRYFNVAGASDDGLIGDSKKPSSLLTQNAVRGALGISPFFLTCEQVETPDKTPIRDYINVADLNEAHLKAFEYLREGGKSEVFNLGTGTGNSVLEIVQSVEKITGKKIEMKNTVARQGEYARMIASTGKSEKILNWKAKRSINDSVSSLVSWYNRHPNGW